MNPAEATIDEFAEMLQNQIEEEGGRKRFDPDDDWMPHAFLCDHEGAMVVAMLDPEFFRDDDTKGELQQALWKLIFGTRAVRAAMVVSAWQAEGPDPSGLDRPPAEREDRKEVVWLLIADFGDVRFRLAEIVRSPDAPPTLEAWQDFDSHGIGGRFMDVLRSAMTTQRDSMEDPVGSFERILENREDLSPEMRARIEHAIKMARDDPEMVENMPTRRWWLERKARSG